MNAPQSSRLPRLPGPMLESEGRLSRFDMVVGLRCISGSMRPSLSEVYVRQGDNLYQVGLLRNCKIDLRAGPDEEDQAGAYVTFYEAAESLHPDYIESMKRAFRSIGVHVTGDEDPPGTSEEDPPAEAPSRYQILRRDVEGEDHA